MAPAANLEGAIHKEVRYAIASGMSRALLLALRQPVLEGGHWTLSETPLFCSEAVDFWSEHSSRHDNPTWVPLAGFSKEWADELGFWGAEGSDSYNLGRRRHLEAMQDEVARIVRDEDPRQAFDEEDLEQAFAVYLRKHDVADGDVDEQIRRVRFPGRGDTDPSCPPTKLLCWNCGRRNAARCRLCQTGTCVPCRQRWGYGPCYCTSNHEDDGGNGHPDPTLALPDGMRDDVGPLHMEADAGEAPVAPSTPLPVLVPLGDSATVSYTHLTLPTKRIV